MQYVLEGSKIKQQIAVLNLSSCVFLIDNALEINKLGH
jgi:hypothetical protein